LSLFKLFFSFKGRLNRTKYFYLFITVLVTYLLTFEFIPDKPLIFLILKALTLNIITICFFALMIRRIRDLNKKLSSILLLMVPFFNIYLLILLFVKKGEKTEESRPNINISVAEKKYETIRKLGLTFKIIAAFMLLSAMLGLVMYFVKIDLSGNNHSNDVFEQSVLLAFVFDHFTVLALLQILIAIGIFYSSVQFIKLRLWARNVLEIFTWFFMGFILCFSVFMITFSSVSSTLFKSMTAVSMGCWAIPVLLLIWLLRKQEVKDAFRH
jgi:uncharacterized membrane protein YhaH (DUF805 family)